jgi:hypothetical protein
MRRAAVRGSLWLGACEKNPPDSCDLGELDCACNAGQCLPNLACEADVCVQQGGESDEVESSSSEGMEQEESSDLETMETLESETGPMCEPPEMLCGDECVDVMTDDLNCGACGNECTVILGEGGCVDGECSPTWSSCAPADPLTLCSVICQAEGFDACAVCGLEDLSVVWFAGPSSCEEGQISNGEAGMCEIEPTAALINYYRCCCAQ